MVAGYFITKVMTTTKKKIGCKDLLLLVDIICLLSYFTGESKSCHVFVKVNNTGRLSIGKGVVGWFGEIWK